jgi:hypothetical protein
MSTSRSMTTPSVVLNSLPKKGYGKEFKITEKGAQLGDADKIYNPSQLTIVKVYRFEGESDPGNMSVIYAIVTDDDQKGFIMNAYGPYSDQDNPYYDEFIKKVKIQELEEM